MNIHSIALAVAMLAGSILAENQLPTTVLFQGHISQVGNSTNVNGTKDVVVKLYEQEKGGNDAIWTQAFANVTFTNGQFAVFLGKEKALPNFSKPLFIELSIDAQTANTRIPITLTPYAHTAQQANLALEATRISPNTDKSITLLDGDNNAQFKIHPDGKGIQFLKRTSVGVGGIDDTRGSCDEDNLGRITFGAQGTVGAPPQPRIFVCTKEWSNASWVYTWKTIRLDD